MKRNWKQWVVLMLIGTLVLAGCGNAPGGSVTPNTTQPGQQETLPPETTQPAGPSLSLGRMEGGIYTNEYVGVSVTLDEKWTFYSAEELQEIPQSVKDTLEGTELGEAMGDVVQITDMMAENEEMLCSMNVLLQKLTPQTQLAYKFMSEEDIYDLMLEQRDLLEESYAQLGMEVVSMEKRTVTFLGQERIALFTESTVEGIPRYDLQIQDYSRGSYAVTITLTSYLEDQSGWMLELFQLAE